MYNNELLNLFLHEIKIIDKNYKTLSRAVIVVVNCVNNKKYEIDLALKFQTFPHFLSLFSVTTHLPSSLLTPNKEAIAF